MTDGVAVIGGNRLPPAAALFTAKAGKKPLLVDVDKGITRRAIRPDGHALLGRQEPGRCVSRS